ncbi:MULTISPECIES: phosphatidate cytidylyltransferase [Anaerostipes]|uniref:phosphatidate cytidylyltransferase n=1 Tax=Anaerostipes TaxID=207244 RepID=UPI0009533CB0|nr:MULTISPECIES: phosphatidate cytidylyltransferase [Anaerostipes]MCI5623289.1 phosphatidate cytidylyltransferase [Anaerostipes sp.]MDY2727102.1 phosphatidate cytidylyltransferase [Anaerostipes faecalis]OLR58374.1 CDP-diglyceride synthetase [Anaerostipes sp. 494a]
MFKQRLLSGIVLVIIAAVGLYMGGIVTFGLTLIVALIGYSEILKIFHIEKSSFAVIGYTGTILYFVALFFDLAQWTSSIIILFLIFLLGCYVIRFPKYKMDQMMGCFFGFVYVGVMLSYIYQLRVLQNGGEFVVLLFLAAWGNDTLAYCTGMLIGKHKMSPVLSPKKSVEGLIGGIVGAAVLGAVYGIYLKSTIRFSFNPVTMFALICAIGAVISVIGDLAASAIKRDAGIKDYGTLIPGHGGILDRFDSIILIAPVIYYLTVMISGGTI